jgi:hypothetical protein
MAGVKSFALSLVKGCAKMSNLETYREKALKCRHAADDARDSGERVELLGLASVYILEAFLVRNQWLLAWATSVHLDRT